MAEPIDDMIVVLDNDEGAYKYIKERVREYGDDRHEVGSAIKEFVSEGSANRLADMILAEFMGSVSTLELGEYYIDEFRDEIPEDDDDEEEEEEDEEE